MRPKTNDFQNPTNGLNGLFRLRCRGFLLCYGFGKVHREYLRSTACTERFAFVTVYIRKNVWYTFFKDVFVINMRAFPAFFLRIRK